MTEKVVDSFLENIDPEKTKVVGFPEFVAVFGGALSKKGSRAKLPKSQRDAFVKWVWSNRPELQELLVLPESYEDWNDFGTYTDLLLFERDLSVLTNAVLVFVEAPGAIAELGAFSQIDTLSQRLVIVVTANRHPRNSFISLGPIRSVTDTQKQKSSVCVIPNAELSGMSEHMPVVMETLDKKRAPESATRTFKSDESQHQILLVLDVINLFLLTTKTELVKLSRHFGVELSTERLEQILFVLGKTGLIKKTQYGTTEYLVPNKFRRTYIDFTANSGAEPFSREKLKTRRFVEINSDAHRRIAYKSAFAEAK